MGGFKEKGVWSLLSLILSIIAVIISILLIVGALAKRKREDEERQKKGAILRILAIIVGVLTPIIWIVLDDFHQPMAWINQWTLIVAIAFIVHIVLFAVYKARNRKDESEESTDNTMTA
jgi:cytochrome bd-type quinol oxidase subunit 2